MNCHSCGRALAGGARRCVYCGQGTEFRPREQLAIPKGTLPERKSAFPWRAIVGALLLAALVVLALQPGVQAWAKGLWASLSSRF